MSPTAPTPGFPDSSALPCVPPAPINRPSSQAGALQIVRTFTSFDPGGGVQGCSFTKLGLPGVGTWIASTNVVPALSPSIEPPWPPVAKRYPIPFCSPYARPLIQENSPSGGLSISL